MIPLKIIEKDEFIKISYENKLDELQFYDELEKEFDEKVKLQAFLSEDEGDAFIRKIEKIAAKRYFRSLDYPLIELLKHFKSITKVYKDYLIVDYRFYGEYLHKKKQNEKVYDYVRRCEFCASLNEDEESPVNFHLLGESLDKFVDVLTQQQILGDIRVKYIKLILIKNKAKGKSKRRKTNVPRGLRHEVFKRDKYTCCECGAKKEDGATLHIDHIIPVSKGGTDELSNLQTLCADCNLNKSNIIQKKVKS